jgi:hypothetical protein
MNWDGNAKNLSWLTMRYCPGILIEELRKTTEILRPDSLLVLGI